jgi:hypothetical protein
MVDDAEKFSSFSKSKKLALGISVGLIVLVLAFFAARRQLEQHLTALIEAKLVKVEGLSIKLGRISLGLSAVHIDQIAIKPAGREDGPGLLMNDVRVNLNLAALIRGTVPMDQLHIKRTAVLPDQYPPLEDMIVSIQARGDSQLVLNFKGKADPGQLTGIVELDRQSPRLQVRAELKGEALRIFHRKIARSPIAPVNVNLSFAGRYDSVQRQLRIDLFKIHSQGLDGIISGHVDEVTSSPRLNLAISIPTIPCQTLLEALPRDFVPDLQGFRLSGNFTAEYRVAIDFDKLEKTQLTGYRGFRDCQTVEAPIHLSEKHFQGSFEHTSRLTVGVNQTFRVGPENPDFVPFARFSDALVGAFLATEDISFFQHAGFVPESLALAIGHNLLESRFAMGGSTITMQMVKNVFLSHEKTLSRKVQELFLTDYVERSLGKQRILEIYLNVIEFGPGIFGIGAAARHYFDKPAPDLTVLESVYLASIVYSPRRHYGSYCRGNISKDWDQRLRQLLRLMHDEELINEADFLASQAQTIVFRKPALGCS